MSEACERKIGDMVVVLEPRMFAAARGKEFWGLKYDPHPTEPRATVMFSGDGGHSILHIKPLEIWQERASGERVLVVRPVRLHRSSPGEH